jgi:hypothetical protein
MEMSASQRQIPVYLLVLVLSLIMAGTCLAGATLTVTPDKTVLSPVLIKKPIMVSGAGWKPGEMVVVNLIIPEGVKVKGVEEGNVVGIASGKADGEGKFQSKVGPITVLMTFFQAGWDGEKMKPDFKKATPLPPRAYDLEAVGLDSETKAKTTLTFMPPPKKKKE